MKQTNPTPRQNARKKEFKHVIKSEYQAFFYAYAVTYQKNGCNRTCHFLNPKDAEEFAGWEKLFNGRECKVERVTIFTI